MSDSASPRSIVVPTDTGELAARRWGTGPRVALALHGITANAMSWHAVGRRLPPEWSLVAIDQRGRGGSHALPGPFGIDQLARDARDAVRATGAELVVGHSMGAYVALALADQHPGTVERLVLVDGGLPLPVPEGQDDDRLDAVLDAIVGPMLARLGVHHRDLASYVEIFRAHPAMGPWWNDDLDAYARADARALPEGGVVAAASPEAVRAAGRELIVRGEEIAEALGRLIVPVDLVLAERGMTDGPEPMLPAEVVDRSIALHPIMRARRVPDTNHYTVLVGEEGAQAVAESIVRGTSI